MRAPSFYQDDKRIDTRGGNLPATIFRLQRQETRSGEVYAALANRLSELIEDVQEVRVLDDPKTETLTLEVRGRDNIFHPGRSLSDGTLRFLVLATLSLDPQARGMICLEEPENGIHPERIPAIVKLLKDIAVDTKYAVDNTNALRQVLINTHSPEVIQNIDEDDLIYIDQQQVKLQDSVGTAAAFRVPDKTWRSKLRKPPLQLAPGKIRSYLGSGVPSKQKQLWLNYAEGH